ncbi:MBL fold metallo-hydrolase [Pelagibacterium montanilacus]|uniref:MBL fold metallo-hydrolase n=1 Tax=Pelagibacterium montanilacus TaxID=2185280 RepID=UPI000F8C95CD|nr:MBL fold metallo-hydrolase [Pelagibacterium montanilacus]
MHPILKFLGAAQGVTGSCFLVQTERSKVLIDCGMFQGSRSERELNSRAFPFAPDEIAAVILTHAHIDHSGLLPRLVREGFRGPIYATAPTVDLCSVMLPDAAYIQEQEAQRRSKRRRWRRRESVEPIYVAQDALDSLELFKSAEYETWTDVAEGLRFRFWNAGHLLGSTSIELEAQDPHQVTRILFSGDIGPDSKLLQSDPEAPAGFDYIVCESTYGATERTGSSLKARRENLQCEVEAAITRGGALLIPSFAVERTQEVLVDLVWLITQGQVQPFPIIIDSPLATKATEVFRKHAKELENGGALLDALDSPFVTVTETVEQSKDLDNRTGFHAVISASGMCDAGRIRHRLKNWLWQPHATVLMVGFQAAGSLGRVLLEGAKAVRIHGEEITVAATIRYLDIYSGHADAPELAAWVSERLPVRGGLFLVHGEPPALISLRERLASLIPLEKIVAPLLDQSFELAPGGAVVREAGSRRTAARDTIGRPDSSNEHAELLLDISDALEAVADERGRAAIIRKLKSALRDSELSW